LASKKHLAIFIEPGLPQRIMENVFDVEEGGINKKPPPSY